jgi:EAL domain-containing protein (putative c-di-GMP-specific phosphodiesterase class I)
VDTAAQVEFLASAGCGYAQGFFFSRPVTAAVATSLLKQQQSCPPKAKWLAA